MQPFFRRVKWSVFSPKQIGCSLTQQFTSSCTSICSRYSTTITQSSRFMMTNHHQQQHRYIPPPSLYMRSYKPTNLLQSSKLHSTGPYRYNHRQLSTTQTPQGQQTQKPSQPHPQQPKEAETPPPISSSSSPNATATSAPATSTPTPSPAQASTATTTATTTTSAATPSATETIASTTASAAKQSTNPVKHAPARSIPLGFGKKRGAFIPKSHLQAQAQQAQKKAAELASKEGGEASATTAAESIAMGEQTANGNKTTTTSTTDIPKKDLKYFINKIKERIDRLKQVEDKTKKRIKIVTTIAAIGGFITITRSIWSPIILTLTIIYRKPSATIESFLIQMLAFSVSPSLYRRDNIEAVAEDILHHGKPPTVMESIRHYYWYYPQKVIKKLGHAYHCQCVMNGYDKLIDDVIPNYSNLFIPYCLGFLKHRTLFHPYLHSIHSAAFSHVDDQFPDIKQELDRLQNNYSVAEYHRQIIAQQFVKDELSDENNDDKKKKDDKSTKKKKVSSKSKDSDQKQDYLAQREDKMSQLQGRVHQLATIKDKSQSKTQFSGLGSFDHSAHVHAEASAQSLPILPPKQFQERIEHFKYYFGVPFDFRYLDPSTNYDDDWLDLPLTDDGKIYSLSGEVRHDGAMRDYREKYQFKTGDYLVIEKYFPKWKYITASLHYDVTELPETLLHRVYQYALVNEIQILLDFYAYIYPYYIASFQKISQLDPLGEDNKQKVQSLSSDEQENNSPINLEDIQQQQDQQQDQQQAHEQQNDQPHDQKQPSMIPPPPHTKERYKYLLDLIYHTKLEIDDPILLNLQRVNHILQLTPFGDHHPPVVSPDISHYISKGYEHAMFTRELTTVLLDEPSIMWKDIPSPTNDYKVTEFDLKTRDFFRPILETQDDDGDSNDDNGQYNGYFTPTELHLLKEFMIPPEYQDYYQYDERVPGSKHLASTMYLTDQTIKALVTEVSRIAPDVKKEDDELINAYLQRK